MPEVTAALAALDVKRVNLDTVCMTFALFCLAFGPPSPGARSQEQILEVEAAFKTSLAEASAKLPALLDRALCVPARVHGTAVFCDVRLPRRVFEPAALIAARCLPASPCILGALAPSSSRR